MAHLYYADGTAHITAHTLSTSYGSLFVAYCGDRVLAQHCGAEGKPAQREDRVCGRCIEEMQNVIDLAQGYLEGVIRSCG